MVIKRMDHVSVVVEDLPAAIAFFATIGMELEGEAPVEGIGVPEFNAEVNGKGLLSSPFRAFQLLNVALAGAPLVGVGRARMLCWEP